MSRTVYVNGEYLPEAQAKISVFDRGFLFADGIYEVSSVLDGKLVDNAAHLARMRRSMQELEMPSPATDEQISAIQRELVTRNQLREGALYLQITRGAADRDFAYPTDPQPSLVMFTQARPIVDSPAAARGRSRGRRTASPGSGSRRWRPSDPRRRCMGAGALLGNRTIATAADDHGSDPVRMTQREAEHGGTAHGEADQMGSFNAETMEHGANIVDKNILAVR